MRCLLGLLPWDIVGRWQKLVCEHVGIVFVAQVVTGSGSYFCGLGFRCRSGGNIRAAGWRFHKPRIGWWPCSSWEVLDKSQMRVMDRSIQEGRGVFRQLLGGESKGLAGHLRISIGSIGAFTCGRLTCPL